MLYIKKKHDNLCYIVLLISLVSPANQIYRLAALQLRDKFNWSMTVGELSHNKTLLVIFYFLNKSVLLLSKPLHESLWFQNISRLV